MSFPLVSVIIPVYNSIKFLPEAISSIFQQTYPEIEIIVVDDGSTDGSFEMAKKLVGKRGIVFRQENLGACAARNQGFKLSKGVYIQYLDADDLLAKDKIEAQLKILSHKSDATIASSKWGRFKEDPKYVHFKDQHVFKSYQMPLQMLIDMWTLGEMMQTSTWLVHRQLIEKVGPWKENLMLNQDGEFFCRVLLMADEVQFSNRGGVYYRSDVTTSISSNRLSRAKAESLFESYRTYENEVLVFDKSIETRVALARNYHHFMYEFFDSYPDLVFECTQRVENLNVKRPRMVGGRIFKIATFILGFNTTLRIRSILKHVFAH